MQLDTSRLKFSMSNRSVIHDCGCDCELHSHHLTTTNIKSKQFPFIPIARERERETSYPHQVMGPLGSHL